MYLFIETKKKSWPWWHSWMRVRLVVRSLRVQSRWVSNIPSCRLVMKYLFSTVILSLPLIHEEHLSVPGKGIFTVLALGHNYFSITFHTMTSWVKKADSIAINAYFLLIMSSCLTFKFVHFTHDHDQLILQLSSVKVNTCQFIPITAHVGSLLRGVLRFTFFLK